MAYPTFLRRLFRQLPPHSEASKSSRWFFQSFQCQYSTTATIESPPKDKNPSNTNTKGKWFTLPPYSPTINGSAMGKAIFSMDAGQKAAAASETTALKWVLRCCPELPRNLVQKLFRLRQVRRESSSNLEHSGDGIQGSRLRRVAAKDSMIQGDQVFLPVTVKELPSEKRECHCSKEEVEFIHSLVMHKDPAIIVVNKPPGMPVQGGIGIKTSLDELASACLKFEYSEPPRLVHRLDRDSSGILVMGRTQVSATALHSIFREKTIAVQDNDTKHKERVLQKRYWALVIGTPRNRKGLISAYLGKVLVDNGKSDRIMVVDNAKSMPCQHALTHYQVIRSSSHGLTWLELSPLTGRKHQLRVHCAEVLGTPIVGDYKYGWQAHRTWQPFPCSEEIFPAKKILHPFGLDLENGSILEKQPRLHLHCKQMLFPDVSQALQEIEKSTYCDFSRLESLRLDAQLPPYMQRSWDFLNS